MKHVAGNPRSPWTDPFTTDGEITWQNRDTKFTNDFETRDDLAHAWNAGWTALDTTLATCTDSEGRDRKRLATQNRRRLRVISRCDLLSPVRTGRGIAL